ncbi:AraC-type DNA-binding protein [Methylocella tundrae]|uniref:AraC-type DNA-binding protein n=2 Tax=Methylocella tundrae TaxID=227605 RepID=A0A8B6M4T1_METTU|nr:AraC-like DNA-binding protein [Methylocella tundrae]VTZ49363.1 AraC-type DNA-binding protein [Methylocella tundrae]
MAMTGLPENLTIRPEVEVDNPASTDLLSRVLAQIHLTGDHVYSRALAPEGRLDLEAEAAHVCIVTQGALRIEGEESGPVVIDEGDLVMLPRGAGDLRLTASGGPATMVLCRFRFDPDSLRGMVSALPGCIHIRRAEGAGWLEGIVHFLMLEAGDIQPGAALMVSRLIDLVVIRTLRSWVHQGPASGWLGGLADVRIANALKAIHERPMQRWSIETLAAIAGMSRSSFCERFTALVGRSPLRYHNEWRLALARDLLSKRDARVGEIGFSIGYESEAAFSRAYKALFGHSPRVDYRLSIRG